MNDKPTPAGLWHQAEYEHRGDAEAIQRRYVELMRQHGHIIDRVTPRCEATDAFYRCTRDGGHDGQHESREDCISAHRWVGSGSAAQEPQT